MITLVSPALSASSWIAYESSKRICCLPQFASLGVMTIRLNIASFPRVDGRGDIFLRPPLSVGACRFVLLVGRSHAHFPSAPHHLRPAGRMLGLGDFFLSPSPSCRLLLACLPRIVPRPPVGGCAGVVPVRRLRAWVRFACVASCSVPLSRLSLVRYCLVIALAAVFSPCGSSLLLACAAAMSSRRASSPIPGSHTCPSSVIRHPSDAIRPMWLIASRSAAASSCRPRSLVACRCHLLGAGCIPIRSSPRLGVSECGAWRRSPLSLVGDLLVFLGGVVGAWSRFASLPGM